MIHLSNIANSVLERALSANDGGLSPAEFGTRFQMLVAAALKSLPGHEDLYDNKGAGQPDCYSNSSGAGYEVKCLFTTRVELDPNSWEALKKFAAPRLVALLTASAPFPLWIVDLKERPESAIALEKAMPVDFELERRLQPPLVRLIEALGADRLRMEDRAAFARLVDRIAEALFRPSSEA